MKTKGKMLEKVKDGLIIARIRVTNFMKEHKYLSAIIGVFLLSSIIALVALADDNDTTRGEYRVTPQAAKASDISSSEEGTNVTVDSFSTVVFDIPYTMTLTSSNTPNIPNRTVTVVAKINSNLDAKWQQPFNETEYTVSEDGKTITAKSFDVAPGQDHNIKLYLNVYNVAPNTQITFGEGDFKIYEETSAGSYPANVTPPTVTIHSTPTPLVVKPYDGNAYKGDLTDGRYAAFGILVGIESNATSLKGMYFDSNLEIPLEATQVVEGSTNSEAITLKTSEGYYGVLDKTDSSNILSSLPNFEKIPNGRFNESMASVFDSGTVTGLVKDTTSSADTNEKTTKNLRLVGPKEMTIGKGDTYTELGVEIVDGTTSTSICKTSTSNCPVTIKKGDRSYTTANISNEVGTYNIEYKYMDSNDIYTLKRTVIVEEKHTATNGSDVYKLSGYDYEVVLTRSDGTYEDLGVMKNQTKLTPNTYTATTIDTSSVGTKTITYSITGTDVTLTRTVKVVNANEYYTNVPVVKTKTKYVTLDSTFVAPKPTINGEETVCSESSTCTISYKKGTTTVASIDTSEIGIYDAIYNVTDANGFEVNTTNQVVVQAKYILKITNIKTDGTFVKKDGMLALGSYFVTAISPRAQGVDGKIKVHLTTKVGAEATAETINNKIAYGSKGVELHLYNSTETEEIGANHIPYGQEVVLSSTFSNTKDADNDLTVTNIVPLSTSSYLHSMGVSKYDETAGLSNNVFTLMKYGSDSGEVYSIEGTGDNIEAVLGTLSVKYYACNATKTPKCKAYSDYDTYLSQKTDGDVLAYLTYSLGNSTTGVKPGSKITFKVRATVNTDVLGTNKLKSVSFFAAIGNNNTGTFDSSQEINVNITSFTARSRVMIDELEQDVLVDGASTNTSTIKIYPSVNMPAQYLYSTAGGINKISSIQVKVTLPNHVRYIYNDEYLKPSVSGRVLTYTISNKKLNDWIDPITLDINYDVDTPSNTNLEVVVETQANSAGAVSACANNPNTCDLSSQAVRTTKRNILYVNTKKISSSLYSPYSGIVKSKPFEVTETIYNNTSTPYSNVDLIMILPYIDEENVFHGKYTLSGADLANMTCSTESAVGLTAENISNINSSFRPCSEYAANNYKDVTILKKTIPTFAAGTTATNKVTIQPDGNMTDDVYQIKGFVVTSDSIEKVSALKVSVISKKITGVVWEDFDANGIMDDGEKKVSDVTLNLYNSSNNQFVQSTLSNSKGVYSFTDLDPGTYYIVAEINGVKYGISPMISDSDRSKTTSFKEAETVLAKPEEEPTQDDEEPSDDTPEEKEEEKNTTLFAKTESPITITNNTKVINDINLGLSLNRVYAVKVRKFVSKAITTNRLGISTIRDYGNVTLAKLDVKDIANLSIKVVYTVELENVGYFPGYVYNVKDYIPDGMKFNPDYPENAGWVENEEGYLENNSLADVLIEGGEKKYLTVAFDIDRKEAGSFINWASVEDSDLQILEIYKEGAGE